MAGNKNHSSKGMPAGTGSLGTILTLQSEEETLNLSKLYLTEASSTTFVSEFCEEPSTYLLSILQLNSMSLSCLRLHLPTSQELLFSSLLFIGLVGNRGISVDVSNKLFKNQDSLNSAFASCS